jgi:tellurite resistance protein
MTTDHHEFDETASSNLAEEIRATLNRLEELNRETAGYLKILAFILHRVAIADDEVSGEEVDRMEQILVDHASLSRSEAMLTVEIARHCGEIADCGCSYEASRKLRSALNEDAGRDIRRFLESVAEADGMVRRSEKAQIRQIATELGLPS